MRIVIWWEQVSWGGVDSHLLTLLKNWPNKEDQFTIFYNNKNLGAIRIFSELSSMDFVQLRPMIELGWPIDNSFYKLCRYLFLPFRLSALFLRAFLYLLRAPSQDVLMVENGGYPGAWGGLMSILAGKTLGIPIRMLIVHHAATHRGPLRILCESLLDIGVQRCATDIIAVSYATRNSLIERRGFDTEARPIRVIHNGIDSVESNISHASLNLRKMFSISDDSFLVGMMGRLERYKGHEDLILALSIMNPISRNKTNLVFIGDSGDAELTRLKSLASRLGVLDKVHFSGFIKGDAAHIISQFDLLAMVTKDFEGFGLTIGEAMINGIPVLATKVGAVTEFIDNRHAFLVMPESSTEIANTLEVIINNHDLVEEKKMAAYENIKLYSGSVMAINFNRVINAR